MDDKIILELPPIYGKFQKNIRTYTYLPSSTNNDLNNELKTLKKNLNSNKNKSLLTIYETFDFKKSVIKEDVFGGKFKIENKEISICRKDPEQKCEKIESNSTIKQKRINTLISRKLRRYMNPLTLYHMVQQFPKSNSTNNPTEKFNIKETNVKRTRTESIACFTSLVSTISSGGTLAPTIFGGCFNITVRIAFFLYRNSRELLLSFMKKNNERLFFEIGNIQSTRKGYVISPINENYRYFMLTEFTQTWPRTRIKIPFIIKIHNSLIPELLKKIEKTIKISNLSKTSNNIKKAANDFINLMSNLSEESPEKSYLNIIKEVRNPFHSIHLSNPFTK